MPSGREGRRMIPTARSCAMGDRRLKATGDEPLEVVNSGIGEWIADPALVRLWQKVCRVRARDRAFDDRRERRMTRSAASLGECQ